MSKIIKPFDWCFISYDSIVNKLLENESKIRSFSFVYGIPNGGLTLARLIVDLFNLKFIDNLNEMKDLTKENAKVLIVDDISDSGKTLDKITKQLNNLNIATLTLLTKSTSSFKPDISLFYIDESFYCNNVWYFGFGMDLFKYRGFGILRNWPHLGWCVNKMHVNNPYYPEHPIVYFAKKLGIDEYLEAAYDNGYIDFGKFIKIVEQL